MTDDKRKRKRELVYAYITYTKTNWDKGLVYSGRTSGLVDNTKPILPQVLSILAKVRDAGQKHHKTKEGYDIAALDRYAVGKAVTLKGRKQDIEYFQIRGREQQLIDYFGGAWSDTGKPYKTGNQDRGVAKDSDYGRKAHEAASRRWRELHPYTGH